LTADFPFVLTQSFTFLPKSTAQALLKSQMSRLRNAGDLAVSQTEELTDAMDAVACNDVVMGDHHFSLQVLTDPIDERPEDRIWLKRLNDSLAAARTIIADAGMVVAREDLGLEAAHHAQLPGNFNYRARKAAITSRNFAALAPFHNFPTGRASGNHWGDSALVLKTHAGTAFHMSFHATDPNHPEGGSRKDIGHTFVCGPTGSGKTVFLGFAMAMLTRFQPTQVVFDKDRGLDILIRALGGRYLPLKNGEATGFNPLQLPPTAANTEFLRLWLRRLVERPGTTLSVPEEADLDDALLGTLSLDPPSRRLSRLREFLDPTAPDGLHARLTRWCAVARGDYAWVFDHPADRVAPLLKQSPLVGFDVTDFLDHPTTRGPITLYLFHLVRQLLDGRRLIVWMDEFAKLLSDPAFSSFAKDGLKTWRKMNAFCVFATQSASDVLESPIARTLIEQTPTKVFFPNPDAHVAESLQGLSLSRRQVSLVKDELEPGDRSFLLKQGHHSMVCELDLQGMAGALDVISGRTESVELVNQLIQQSGEAPALWLPKFLAIRERRRSQSSSPSSL
jgi:type IV secretion system protein VirB4